ncbi:hypothetical protein [Pectobacterium brasiliense]|uniref:hypothetical protein n=1 Tax=Pectobacterium brasiliense TaxID=180957 RepID=UPI0019699372|nr:hypothetical protein [Pectobacterium brasiliense]MBN3264425.1 hypothetical protein [Pectobacterium brasiliense]
MKINYQYGLRTVMLFVGELITFIFRAFIYWPSIFVGGSVVGFFLLGLLSGEITSDLNNVLSALPPAYQSSSPTQVTQFANSVYCILVVVAGCIEALIRYGYPFTRFSSLSRRCEPVVKHGSYRASRNCPHKGEDKVDE